MYLFQDYYLPYVTLFLAPSCVIVSYADQTYFPWHYKMRREGPNFIRFQEMSFLGCYRLPTTGGSDCRLGNSGSTFP
jgi:hypothetical protein